MCIIVHVSLVLTGLQEFSYVSSEHLGSDALIRVGGLIQRTMREGFVKIGAFFPASRGLSRRGKNERKERDLC